MCDALGAWGASWVEIAPEHLDPYAALWGMCRGIGYLPLPDRRVTVRFELRDTPRNQRRFWLLVHRPEPEVCVEAAGLRGGPRRHDRSRLARPLGARSGLARARDEGAPRRGRRTPAPGAHARVLGRAGRTGGADVGPWTRPPVSCGPPDLARLGLREEAEPRRLYGVVVDSVNVSVFAYVPVRSGSFAPIDCWRSIVSGSLLTGAAYVFSVSGLPLIAPNAAGATRA